MTILAADFGGTRIKLAIVTDAQAVATDIINVTPGGSLESHLPAIRDAYLALLESTQTPLDKCSAVVWALPCLVAGDGVTVTKTFGKFEDSVTLDLTAWSRTTFGLPIIVENDARAAAIGEWKFGAGKGTDNLVMITLGTGIGTAVILNGRPLYGAAGMAGNLGGHSITHRDGELCTCGIRGCAEAQVATWNIPNLAKASPQFATSALATVPIIDYRAIFTNATAGDPLATTLRDRALDTWGALTLTLIHNFDPERVIIGGGIMASKDLIIPAIQKIADQSAAHAFNPVAVVPSQLADDAGPLGCFAIASDRIA